MIAGVGIDIASVARIRGAIERHGDRFLRKVFRPREIEYCRCRAREFEHLAGRFAAKEAVLKALGTGVADGASLRDVEVVNNDAGKPDVVLHGAAGDLVRARGIARIHLSLSHTDDAAVAQVVMETA